MRIISKILPALMSLVFIFHPDAAGQSGRGSRTGNPSKKVEQAEAKSSQAQKSAKENTPEADAIRLDTTLVIVPVIASDRNLVYIPDMRKDEFSISEDGVEQK